MKTKENSITYEDVGAGIIYKTKTFNGDFVILHQGVRDENDTQGGIVFVELRSNNTKQKPNPFTIIKFIKHAMQHFQSIYHVTQFTTSQINHRQQKIINHYFPNIKIID